LSLGGPLDILMGKPLPVECFESLFLGATDDSKKRLITEVKWLVDSKERFLEYLKAFEKEGLSRYGKLKISLEVDVGLCRGGFETPRSLKDFLETIKTESVQVTGLMGYDGHLGLGPSFLRAFEFGRISKNYQAFAEVLEKNRKESEPFVFNGAGSRTFSFYKSLVNDVAIGSGFLSPAHFKTGILKDHKAAVFIAAPILKEEFLKKAPFLGKFLTKLLKIFLYPGYRHFFIYGGGWGEIEYPKGAKPGLFYNHGINKNLLPNQELISVSGDFKGTRGNQVFYRPQESDILMNFNELIVVQGGNVIEKWSPFSRRL